jgi:hypothetical protein
MTEYIYCQKMLKYCIKLRNKVPLLQCVIDFFWLIWGDFQSAWDTTMMPKWTQKSQLHIVVVVSNLISQVSQINTIF